MIRPGALVGVLALAGCRGPSGVPAPSSEVPTPPVAYSTLASASAAPPAVSATRAADGCWGLALPTEPVLRLAKLGERCAEGASALFPEPRRVEGATSELTLPMVPDGACLRVAAVSGATVGITVLAAGGATIATDRDAAFSLAPLRGPFCPRGGGVVTVRLDRDTPGPTWVQAWSTAR